jgi:hypothetical protein
LGLGPEEPANRETRTANCEHTTNATLLLTWGFELDVIMVKGVSR